MESMFRKDSMKFDRTNYDSWKENMKTHFLCGGPRYWILKKTTKIVIAENNLETCTEAERDLFMCDMRAREALLFALPDIEYNQVKSFVTSHLIWKDLENIFEGDAHLRS